MPLDNKKDNRMRSLIYTEDKSFKTLSVITNNKASIKRGSTLMNKTISKNRLNIPLKQLLNTSLSELNTTDNTNSSLDPLKSNNQSLLLNVIYLQFNNIIKKIKIQPLTHLDQLKTMFSSIFGVEHINKMELKNTDDVVFYELTDVCDILDKAIIKINNNKENKYEAILDELKEIKTNIRELKQPTNVTNSCWADLNNILNTMKKELKITKNINLDIINEMNLVIKDVVQYSKTLSKQMEGQTTDVRKMINMGKIEILNKQKMLYERVELLQTNLEDMRIDIIKRKATPTQNRLQYVNTELQQITEMLEKETLFIDNVKPVWKQTWENELKIVVEEQTMLKEHLEIVENYSLDIKEMKVFHEQLLQLLQLRNTKRTSTNNNNNKIGFNINCDDLQFAKESMLHEIQCVEIDHEKRLQAINHNTKIRQWELDNKTNEFEKELSDFVCLDKLNKTGGIDLVDKKRLHQDETNLKQMFQNNNK